ncbi:MAG: anaerobic ribonucleoside-triphosphate reductase activating protein [Thiovulaceae bacterium]|jgi:pyruvate formate lyase activating enzyme|nr:anaerobic ribonucleoside-triphosphate reductase activating protein [Sulfurimonadaceae bacterium]MDD3817100.1 anaerobic ribonucleoside-triphosphate reductase activating protein [Sulfurimonadaceae bacterium]
MNALYDITPCTLLDFRGVPAAIFWFAGCNLRCSYCYNPEIVFSHAKISQQEALAFLEKRKGLLEGVVLSGGEATLYSHIEAFAAKIKKTGFKIKLDTNATRPRVLQKLLDASLLEYVALDYKGLEDSDEELFWESYRLLARSGIDFEVRTTYHSRLIPKEKLLGMYEKLSKAGYKKEYYVQPVRSNVATIGDIEEETMRSFAWIESFATLRA